MNFLYVVVIASNIVDVVFMSHLCLMGSSLAAIIFVIVACNGCGLFLEANLGF